MPNRPIIPLIGVSLVPFMYDAVRAESTQERVALMLSGPDCPSIAHTITTTLQQQTGVLRADQDLIPDHVVIDIRRETLTEKELAAIANQAIGGAQCRAEIMKSCISADMGAHLPSKTP